MSRSPRTYDPFFDLAPRHVVGGDGGGALRWQRVLGLKSYETAWTCLHNAPHHGKTGAICSRQSRNRPSSIGGLEEGA
jgi:hypothetical protein